MTEPTDLVKDPELEEKVYMMGARLTGYKSPQSEGEEEEGQE